MPLYEYECKECHKNVEILVNNMSTKPECPECGSKKLTKLLSVIGSPVIQSGARPSSSEGGTCGRPQCGSGGCMFGN